MSTVDQTKEDVIEVEELMEFSNQIQAEKIADHYSLISNQYDPIKLEDFKSEGHDSKSLPLLEPYQVYLKMKKMKKKSSTVLNDVPWKVIFEFSVELAEPLCHIFNSSIIDGVWPDSWKQEIVTPVPKVFPPKKPKDLRKISGTKNFSKFFEAVLSDTINQDIQSSIDPAQYGNEKGLSTAHYLVKMVHRILEILDTNTSTQKYAVIAKLIDWSQAFDRVDAKLGLEAFIKCGLRPSLVPLLGSFFQDRRMIVKWHGCVSTERDLPGGVPQGSLFGNLQYKVSSNDNANHVDPQMKYKFVDDLSLLEKINLIIAGISSYNFKQHVASDIGTDQSYIPSQNLSSQKSLNNIETWTSQNLAKLNVQKTKIMVFNFNDNFQFATRLHLEDTLLEITEESKLLGTIVTSDLKWQKNTEMLTKKAYQRMQILHKLIAFHVDIDDLKEIYILYIRSILEYNCPVWHFSLTDEDRQNLERVQKIACRLILQADYEDYKQALNILNLEDLDSRRTSLCLKFAKKSSKHSKLADMFPKNCPQPYSLRSREKYLVHPAKTERLLNSAIPQMQRLLNADSEMK